jgi:hypothetical protein
VVTEKNATANTAFAANHEECVQSIGKMIQDLFCSDNDEVDAALDALDLNLDKDKKKTENIQAVEGCLALVQLLEERLGQGDCQNSSVRSSHQVE